VAPQARRLDWKQRSSVALVTAVLAAITLALVASVLELTTGVTLPITILLVALPAGAFAAVLPALREHVLRRGGVAVPSAALADFKRMDDLTARVRAFVRANPSEAALELEASVVAARASLLEVFSTFVQEGVHDQPHDQPRDPALARACHAASEVLFDFSQALSDLEALERTRTSTAHADAYAQLSALKDLSRGQRERAALEFEAASEVLTPVTTLRPAPPAGKSQEIA
jgi:hypothetical protein